MKIPPTMPQMWEEFIYLIEQDGIGFFNPTENFKLEIYNLFLEGFKKQEYTVKDFAEDFLAYFDEPSSIRDIVPSGQGSTKNPKDTN